jgi:hypothetical protein
MFRIARKVVGFEGYLFVHRISLGVAAADAEKCTYARSWLCTPIQYRNGKKPDRLTPIGLFFADVEALRGYPLSRV